MADFTPEILEERLKRLKQSAQDWDKSEKLAKEISQVQQINSAKQKKVEALLSEGIQFQGQKIGGIDRILRAASILSTANATYTAQKAALSGATDPYDLLALQLKTYLKDIAAEAKTIATGREARTAPKLITKDMLGISGFGGTSLGIAGDILLDPTGAVPIFKGVAGLLKMTSVPLKGVVSKIPAIKAGAERLSDLFNLFGELERAGGTKLGYSAQEFKDAFRVAVHAKDFSVFKKFGIENFSPSGWATPAGAVKWTPPAGWEAALSGHGLKGTYFEPQLAKILTEAFGDTAKAPAALRGYDWLTTFYKKMLAWSPKFQTRNAADAIMKNAIEGVSLGDYYGSLKLMASGGKSNPAVYDALTKGGVIGGTTGMLEPGAKSIPGMVAGWVESWLARVPLALNQLKKGKSFAEAIKKTEDVQYKYATEYLTAFEKGGLSRLFPFYKFQKGQFSYWPEAMQSKQGLFSWGEKFRTGTQPDIYRTAPWLQPEWTKGLSIDTFGNLGSSVEDFANIMQLSVGDLRGSMGQLNYLLRMPAEYLADWKVFAGKPISADTSARDYKHAPFIRDIVGYNPATGKTENTTAKWFIEGAFGPVLKSYLDLTNPKKSLYESMFSPRDYRYSIDDLGMFYNLKNQPQPAQQSKFLDVLKSIPFIKELFSPGIATAASGPPIPTTAHLGGLQAFAAFQNAEAQKRLLESKGIPTAGKSLDEISQMYRNMPAIYEGTERDRQAQMSREAQLANQMVVVFKSGTADIGKNWATTFGEQFKNLKLQFDLLPGVPDAEKKKYWDALLGQEELFRPRRPGEKGAFRPEDLLWKRPIGNDPISQAIRELQEEDRNFRNRTTQLLRTAQFKQTPDYIRQFIGQERGTIKYLKKTTNVDWPEEYWQQREEVLKFLEENMLEDLRYKTNAVLADTAKILAEGLDESTQKIQAMRDAEIAKFYASTEARMLIAQGDQAHLMERVAAITAEYDKKIRVRRALEAKSQAEALTEVYKGEFESTIQALQSVFERGGMSIPEYFKGQREAVLKEAGSTAGALMDRLSAEYRPLIPEVARPPLYRGDYSEMAAIDPIFQGMVSAKNETTARLRELLESFGGMTKTPGVYSISDMISILTEAYQLIMDMAGQPLSGDVEKFHDLAKAVQALISKLKETNEKLQGGEAGAKIKLGQSYEEMQANLQGIQSQIWTSQAKISPLGMIFAKRAGWTEPSRPMPATFDVIQEQFKSEIQKNVAAAAQDVQKMMLQFPASGLSVTRTEGEDEASYRARVEAAMQDHEANKVAMTEDGAKKIAAIRERYRLLDDQQNLALLQREEAYAQARVSIAQNMASMIGQTAEMIYNASGQSSREFFYLMKAAKVAEAMITGTKAILDAYASGMSIGGPPLAMAYAGIAATFVGTQIGLLISSAFQGPGKAKGGKIEGGSGTQDDVQLRAMGGEWIIRKSSVAKYGDKFMDALNRGILDISPISVPNLPDVTQYQSAYADGGKVVSPETAHSPISVEITNKSGVPLRVTDASGFYEGQRYVVNVLLDAVDRNVDGIGDLFTRRGG